MEPSGYCPACTQPLPVDTPLGGVCPQCLIKSGFYSGTAPKSEQRESTALAIADLAPHFPQLEILEFIGRGGMGAVYKARQPRLNRLVALKVLARERDADARFAERFLREAQALAQLSHPNIVTVHDFGETGGHYYLIMEYVDGLNLRELERSRKLSPEEALVIVPGICDALQYAHQQGIVHRDIKPENILIDKQGRVKIADFGIAKLLGMSAPDEPLTGEQQRVGTPLYMAPEQVEKPTTVDHRADIYSLGVVFYEMLTGELPIGRFAAPSQKVEIDVRLDEIVMRALEKEPERRYQQVSEIKTQMETLSTPAIMNKQTAARTVTDHTSQRAAMIVTAVIMGMMLLIGPEILNGLRLVFWTVGFGFGLAITLYRIFLQRPRRRGNIGTTPNRSIVPKQQMSVGDRAQIRSQLVTPAVGLMISAVLSMVPMLILTVRLVVTFFVERSGSPAPVWKAGFISVPLLLISVLSIFTLLGAINMLRLKRRGAAVVAAILAMILPPGLILGLPFGIWALVVLNREDVKAAFEAQSEPSKAIKASTSQKPATARDIDTNHMFLSGKALFGFLWALPAMIYMLAGADAFPILGNLEHNPASLMEAINRLTFGLFAIAIPGTPILGLIAINDIRRSGGRFNGAALAALDVVIFPGVVFWKFIWANLPHNATGPLTAELAVFGIVAGLMVLVAVVLRSYANYPLSPAQIEKQRTTGYRRAISNSILVALVICSLVYGVWPELKLVQWKPGIAELIVIVALWIVAIAALYHIGAQRARSTHRANFASIATAVLVVLGFMVWSDSLERSILRADRTDKVGTEALLNDSRPTTSVTFPNGIKATLSTIAMHPDNETVWRVDGSSYIASEDDPYNELDIKVKPDDNQIAREFHFEFDNVSTEPLSILYQVEDGRHVAGASDVIGNKHYLRLASTLPGDKTFGRIRIGLPAIDWQSVGELSLVGGSSFQQTGSEQSTIIVTSGKPYFQNDQLHVLVSHLIRGFQFRIVAIDSEENQYTPELKETPPSTGGLSQVLYVFPGVTSTTKLTKLQCQLKSYHWMSFENIPLRPESWMESNSSVSEDVILKKPETRTKKSAEKNQAVQDSFEAQRILEKPTTSSMLLMQHPKSAAILDPNRPNRLPISIRDYLTAALPTTTVVDFASGNYLNLDTNSFTTTTKLVATDELTSLGVHLYRSPYQSNLNALTGHNLKLAQLEDKIWDSISLQHITQLPVSFKKMWQNYSTPGAIEPGVYLFDTGKNLGTIRVKSSPNEKSVIVEIKTAKR